MSIRFIQKNFDKMSDDNMINILSDLILKNSIEYIEDFNIEKSYSRDDKVYIKDDKGVHNIYVCKVFNSTIGEFKIDEWNLYLKPDETNLRINQVDIIEETSIVDTDKPFTYKIKHEIEDIRNITVAVYNSVSMRLRQGIDFILTNTGIVKFLKSFNIGEKMIYEIRKLNGKVFKNIPKEVYVEEIYIPKLTTKFVPIRYPYFSSTSRLEVFDKDGKLMYENVDYTLIGKYIILNKSIPKNTPVYVNIWNEVMINITSSEYLIDENNNVYKLGVNDKAQLTLTAMPGEVVLSNGYIDLISSEGMEFRCTVNSNKQLVLTHKNPELLLSNNGNTYKISVDAEGELYLHKLTGDYDANTSFTLISNDDVVYDVSADGEKLRCESIPIYSTFDEFKYVISDDSKLYEMKVVDGLLKAVLCTSDYSNETPIEYLMLLSESEIPFMLYATNDGHLALRCRYIIDENSNILVSEDGFMYLLGVTNESEVYTEFVNGSIYATPHKYITDDNKNLYKLTVDNEGHIIVNNEQSVIDSGKRIHLYSDANDSHYVYVDDDILESVSHLPSTIIKDIRTNIHYRLYVENNDICMERVLSEKVEKNELVFYSNSIMYKFIVDNGELKFINTGIKNESVTNESLYMSDYNNINMYMIRFYNGSLKISLAYSIN